MPKLTDIIVHIRNMGRDVRVTAIFTSDAEANAHIDMNPHEGVIAECKGVVFLADVRDLGHHPRR